MTFEIDGSSKSSSVSSVEETKAESVASSQSALLPDPLTGMAMGDDAIAQITSLLAKSLRDDRKSSRDLANVEDKLAAQETAKRVSEMHDKADAIRTGGLAEGLAQIGAGGLQIGAAATSSKAVSGTLTGAASGATGAGSIMGGIHKAEAADCDAAAAEHEANADGAKRRGERHRDDMQEAKRMLDKVADFLKEMRGGQNAAAAAALYRA